MAFRAVLWKYPSTGGWHFASIPDEHAPPAAGPWGRTAVTATIDGVTVQTSAWRDRERGWLLPVPKRLRGQKTEGDTVEIELGPPITTPGG